MGGVGFRVHSLLKAREAQNPKPQAEPGQEEALGLRLIIGAQTIMVPTVYDPSELRSDVNGKVEIIILFVLVLGLG